MSLEIKISRFERSIQVDKEHVATLEIEDKHLFTRVLRSLLSGAGMEADEPYQIWKNDRAVSSKKALLIVNTLPHLPLTDKSLLSSLYEKLTLQLNDDIAVSSRLQSLALQIEDVFGDMEIGLWGSYRFATQWNTTSYFKAFSFQPMIEPGDSLLDDCVKFFGLCADISFTKAIVLTNAKSFFTKTELQDLFSQAIFYGVSLLLLESWHDEAKFDLERKLRVDKDFIEF